MTSKVKGQKGFTLIELLIVVVIIGILAAIAIPRFGETRERAYVSAMQSDLSQLQTAQEMYYQDGDFEYYGQGGAFGHDGGDVPDELTLTVSEGVTIEITSGDSNGWSAEARHEATEETCEVYVGEEGGTHDGEADNADEPGVINCGDFS